MRVTTNPAVVAVALLLQLIVDHAMAGEREDRAARMFFECDWETEKVMVIYKAVFDGGQLGRDEVEALSSLDQLERAASQQLGNRAPGAAESKTITDLAEKRKLKAREILLRESRVRNKLIDKCMRARGLAFAPTCDPHITDEINRSYYDSDPSCWK